MAALVLVATACDRSGGGGADANVTAWCAQLDVAATAGAAVDDLDVDDPGTDEALAAERDAFAALADLEPPAAIAGDWETVTGPLPTTEAGGIDLEGGFDEAGGRISTGAPPECDLSSVARAEMESSDD